MVTNTNEEMRGGDDMFFVTHAPTMKALGEHNMAMWAAQEAKKLPESPIFIQSSDELFVVDYRYKEGAI